MKGAHWLSLLLALALLSAALAYFGGFLDGGGEDGEALLPDLEQRFDSLDAIHIRAGAEMLRVERDEGQWRIRERRDYPADPGRLSNLLTDLSEIKLREQMTARAENHARLQLFDPAVVGDDEGAALRLEIFADGETYAALLFGAESETRSGMQYFRRADAAQTWLIAPRLEDASADPVAWLRQPLLSVDAGRVKRLVFSSPDEKLHELQRDNPAAAFNFEAPPGFRVKKDSALEKLAAIFEDVRMEDLASEEDEANFEPYLEIIAQCYDGLSVKLSIGESEDGVSRLVTVRASGAQPESKKEAAELVRRHKGWVYVLTTDGVEKLRFDMAEFIEEIPEGESEEQEAPAAPTPILP